jgi:hypothetical protein
MISTRASLDGTRETPGDTLKMLSSHTENRTNDVFETDSYAYHAAIPFCARTEYYYSGGVGTQRNEPRYEKRLCVVSPPLILSSRLTYV